MLNLVFGTNEIEIHEIWTTQMDGPNSIRTNLIRAEPKIERVVNRASAYWFKTRFIKKK